MKSATSVILAAIAITSALAPTAAQAGTVILKGGPLPGGGTRNHTCQVANDGKVTVTAMGTIWNDSTPHSQTVTIGPHQSRTVAESPVGTGASYCSVSITSTQGASTLLKSLTGTFQLRDQGVVEAVVPLH